MNEKFSPELLEHKTHIVDCILEQIKEMVSHPLMDRSYLPTAYCTGGKDVYIPFLVETSG